MDPLRHHKQAHAEHGTDTQNVFGDSFMERASEKVATGMGTVQFVVVSTLLILGWVLANHVVQFLGDSWHGLLNGKGFDPAPFILLNLMFSAVAFYTGALVIIAQKAEAKKNKVREEADARHREELAIAQTTLLNAMKQLLVDNTHLTEADKRLTEEVHGRLLGGQPDPSLHAHWSDYSGKAVE